MRLFLASSVLVCGLAAGACAFAQHQQRLAEDQACVSLATARLARSAADPESKAREVCTTVARLVSAGVTPWRPALEELLTLPSGPRSRPVRTARS